MQGATTFEPGSTIADFRVASLLRSVGGANVYLAEQAALGRRVALVVSSAPSESEPGARFGEIARRLAVLEHPHVLPIYEVGSAGGVAFAAVREPPGRTLDELLRDGPLTPERSAAIGEQLTGALHAIDRAGVGRIELARRDVFVSGADDVQVAALEAALASSTAPDAGTTVARLLEGAASAPAPARSRRRLAVGAAIVVVAAFAAALIAALSGSDEQAAPQTPARHAPADAPAARLVATIALNATPGSAAVGEGAVWVATTEGDVLRIDPRTSRVVGAPIRFAPSDRRNNVTVRVGAGAVFALDGNRGRIVRIDPRTGRVTLRRTLGGIVSGATVSDRDLWVLRWDLPRGGRPIDELVRLDADTLRSVGKPVPIGRPIRLGPQAADVEAEHGVAWVTNTVEGTVARYDSRANSTTIVHAALQPVDSALRDGTLWVPDVGGGALAPIDGRRLTVGDSAMHSDYPLSVASTRDALWVEANTTNTGPGGPARLYRIDPRTHATLGAPVDLGQDVGWLAAGGGAVWVRSMPRRALLKYVATSPAPAAARVAAPKAGPRRVAAGPLAPGEWATGRFSAALTFSIGEPGWMLLNDSPRGIGLARFDDPLASVNAVAPRQAFTPAGNLRRLRTPEQAVDLVASNRHIRVVARRRTTLGGVPATELTVRVRRYEGFPGFCGSPCVVLYPLPAGSSGVEVDKASRLWFLLRNGQTVIVSADVDAHRPDFARAEALLRTLRFR